MMIVNPKRLLVNDRTDISYAVNKSHDMMLQIKDKGVSNEEIKGLAMN